MSVAIKAGGIALALLSFFVASEYTPSARFANHTSAFDTEISATQKALTRLQKSTQLAYFATWLQCPIDERTTIIIAPLPSAPDGVEIQKSLIFERYFVKRPTRVNPATYSQCRKIDAQEIMKGATA